MRTAAAAEKKTGFAKTQPLTAQQFYQYLQCPHWIWFDRFGDQSRRREISALQKKLLERGVVHEEDYIKDQDVTQVFEEDIGRAAEKTQELMQKGAERIYHGALVSGRWRGRPDILEREEGNSSFGSWQYVPLDIKSSHHLHPPQELQLVFYALLLEDAQGVRPVKAGIINVEHERIFFEVEKGLPRFTRVLAEISKIVEGKRPVPYLTRQCMETPWFGECKRLAEEKNDIALIYNVKRPVLHALRENGVKTVADAAFMDPGSLAGSAPGLTSREAVRIRRQATALMKKSMIIKRQRRLPTAPLTLYFDIEGDPLYGVEYLFGFLIDQNGKEEYKGFVAEKPEDEEKMWKAFLAWVKTLPAEYIVFHYATYEKSRVTLLEKKYGGGEGLHAFRERLVDLAVIIRDSVVLPLYFYGLKDIAKHLGFSWSHKEAGGTQSIAWYEDWLETKDRHLLETILAYNEDDVRATKFLKEWIEKIGLPAY